MANALIRDRMPYLSVMRRMQEDYRLELLLGYLHACFLWAHEQLNLESHWDFVRANFSGVLCLDEVHDSGRTILFATDPLGLYGRLSSWWRPMTKSTWTRFYTPSKVVDWTPRWSLPTARRFTRTLCNATGLRSSINFASSMSSRRSTSSSWTGCVPSKTASNARATKGARSVVVGPAKRAQQRRLHRSGMSKKEQATFIWEHQYLIVRKEDDLSEQDRADLAQHVSDRTRPHALSAIQPAVLPPL